MNDPHAGTPREFVSANDLRPGDVLYHPTHRYWVTVSDVRPIPYRPGWVYVTARDISTYLINLDGSARVVIQRRPRPA